MSGVGQGAFSPKRLKVGTGGAGSMVQRGGMGLSRERISAKGTSNLGKSAFKTAALPRTMNASEL
jgi:hypothetical protein